MGTVDGTKGFHEYPNHGWHLTKTDIAKEMTTRALVFAQRDCVEAGKAIEANEGKYSAEAAIYHKEWMKREDK